MSKHFVISEADRRRLSALLEESERQRRIVHPVARRVRGIPSGGTGIRKAYCKTAAGTGATIACYLDTDGTGEEVTVTCTLIQASNLSSCFPTLADGTMMPVWKDGDTWRSLWWFYGKEPC